MGISRNYSNATIQAIRLFAPPSLEYTKHEKCGEMCHSKLDLEHVLVGDHSFKCTSRISPNSQYPGT